MQSGLLFASSPQAAPCHEYLIPQLASKSDEELETDTLKVTFSVQFALRPQAYIHDLALQKKWLLLSDQHNESHV